jgi:rare lipoprotein A
MIVKLNLISNTSLFFLCIALSGCGGESTVKSNSPIEKPVETNIKPTPKTSTTNTNNSSQNPATEKTKPGGYYLDDGPDDNPPPNLDNIPSAIPRNEPLLPRANMPYKALGQAYTPIPTSQDYKAKGIASWYGKRFHGKKTSSGEVYDMYGMTAAHAILPLPSYVKVINPENGRSVIVRINDRGPFKSNRIIDLSYAAAYQLRLIGKGSGMVELEAIHIDSYNANLANSTNNITIANSTQQKANDNPAVNAKNNATLSETSLNLRPKENSSIQENTNIASDLNNQTSKTATIGYFIQAGAFKSEANAVALMKKIQGLDIDQNAGINKVYNDGIHRLRLGPFETKSDAERVATNIRKKLNISTIISNQ